MRFSDYLFWQNYISYIKPFNTMPNYNGTEGTLISKQQAKALTAKFQADHPAEKKGYFFGRNHLEDILQQDHCKGIRVYLGKTDDEDPHITLVLVGADDQGDDQSTLAHKILDFGDPCPTSCSKPSEAIG